MKKKIVELKFKKSKQKYYLGNIREIYERWTKDELGAVIGTVLNVIHLSQRYENNLIIIKYINAPLGYLLPDRKFINTEDLHFRKTKK